MVVMGDEDGVHQYMRIFTSHLSSLRYVMIRYNSKITHFLENHNLGPMP